MKKTKKVVFEEVIQPQGSLAFTVKKGQYLRIIDIEGKQVGDLVMFNEHDHTEKLDVSYTRSNTGKPTPREAKFNELTLYFRIQGVTTGHRVLSSLRRPMMTITADTAVPGGSHDLVSRMCTSYSYEREEGREPKHPYPEKGCFELLDEVLKPHGIAKGNIPNAFCVWMNTLYDMESGMLKTFEPVSRPGDYIEFRAEMDCLCALTSCPMGSCAPPTVGVCKPLKVQILEE